MTGIVVAVVDDNASILRATKALLEMEGYEVIAHPSAASFLADRTTRAACLIVDQNMPEMTGIQLAEHLRQQMDNIPILLISGSLFVDIAQRAAELGVDKLLQKPVEPEDILKHVAQLVRRPTL
jgi:two-component system response regulator FixJ